MISDLLTEKLRPKKFEHLILSKRLASELGEGDVQQNLLLYGPAGTGKTSAAKVLAMAAQGHADFYINCSDETGVDVVREKISRICSSMSVFDGELAKKVVILDEIDGVSEQFFKALRGTMEKFHNTRFIATCLTGDTKVYSQNGYKYLSLVKSGDLLKSSTKEKPYLSNKLLINNGLNEIFEIKTLHGNIIRCTADHKFRHTLKSGEIVWTKASDLYIGKRLDLDLSAMYGSQILDTIEKPLFNSNDQFDQFDQFDLDFLFSNDSNKICALGRLCGFIYGDGHLHSNGVTFTGNYEALVLAKKDMELLFGQLPYSINLNNGKWQNKKSKGYQFAVPLKKISNFFIAIGCQSGSKVKNLELRIPEFIRNGPDLVKKSFVQALFDNDGNSYFQKNKTTRTHVLRQNSIQQSSLIKDVSEILTYFNIKNTVTISNANVERSSFPPKDGIPRLLNSINISTQNSIFQFMSVIGNYYEKHRIDIFGHLMYKLQLKTYKFIGIDSWIKEYNFDGTKISDPIVSIKKLETKEEVYDCSFSEIHSYVTNGLVSHNCNFFNKIPEPIQSRFQCVNFGFVNYDEEIEVRTEWAKRVELVMGKLGISATTEALEEFVTRNFPDMRSALNKIQNMQIRGVETLTADDVRQLNWSFEDLYKVLTTKTDSIKVYQFVVSELSTKIDEAMNAIGSEFIDWIIENKPELKPQIPHIIIAAADYQAKRHLVIDPVVAMNALCYTVIQKTTA